MTLEKQLISKPGGTDGFTTLWEHGRLGLSVEAHMINPKYRELFCGVNQIYDGSFSGKLITGSGIFAQALKDAGYQVIDAEEIGKH